MTGPRPRRLALVLAALALAAAAPTLLAYDGGTGTHSTDLQLLNLTVHEAGEFSDDRLADRVDFLEAGANPDVTVVINLNNDTPETDDPDYPRNVSVTLRETSGADIEFGGPTCWNYERTPDHDDPATTGWNASVTGINVTSPGNITLHAWVNTDESSQDCQYPAYGETTDLGKTNNDQSRTIHVGAKPDLAAPGPGGDEDPIAWCWVTGDRPGDVPSHNSTLCPTGQAVNASNPEVAHPTTTPQENRTYFRIFLENLGNYTLTAPGESQDAPEGEGDDGTFTGIQDPDDTDAALRHQVNVTLTNEDRDQTWDRSRTDGDRVDYLGNVSSTYFDLTDKPAGPYRVEVAIDEPQDRIEEGNETNNSHVRSFTLFGPDVEPAIDRGDIRTDPDDPYEYGDSARSIEVDVTIDNLGNRTATGGWTWTAQLNPDHPDRRHKLNPGTSVDRTFSPNLGPDDDPAVRTLNITYCQQTDDDCYLPAGEHTLDVSLDTEGGDPWNTLNEERESNNGDQVTFYINDTQPPQIEARSPPPPEIVRVGDEVTFLAEITEDDPNFQNVTLHLDEPGDGDLREVDMTPTQETEGGPDWNFTTTLPDLTAEGNYTWWVTGSDPSGNAFSTAGDPLTFEVAQYPKRIEVESPPPPEGNQISWEPEGFPTINFTATINGTGWEPLNSTTGKHLNLTGPLGSTVEYELRSQYSDASCQSEGPNCDQDLFYIERNFFHPDTLTEESEHDPDMPGRWNATYAVQDKAGIWREETIRFRVQDEVPEVSGSLTEVETPLGGAGEVNSESQFTVTTNATDPDGCWYTSDGCGHHGPSVVTGFEHGMQAVHVNFTHRPTGEDVNLTMVMTDGNETESNWTRTVTTGRNADLPWAGTYNYSIEGRDLPRNWDTLPADHDSLETPRVTVFDTRQPTIADFGADPETEETNVPIRFFAEVDDDTATKVRVSIEPPADSAFCGAQDQCSFSLDQVKDTDRYRKNVNFSTPGEYDWEVIATDSAEHSTSTSTNTLTIVRNRPPLVDVVLPDAPAGEGATTFYTSARVELFLSITDPSGIQRDTINLTVDGNTVNHSAIDEISRIESPPARKPGYNISYTVPSRYNDSAEIPVQVSARDDSNQQKLASVGLDLIVDAAAPDAELEMDKVKPKYRAGGNLWNVSPHTEFVLSGSDPGQTSSGVGEIKYQLSKESAGAPITYEGPFKINRSKPGWAGPGVYDLTYWAVDRVGNDGLHRTRSVRLDLSGPEITYFPKGRFVNASISDPQGVSDATLNFKGLDEENFRKRSMTFEEGLYRAKLPDLPLGERMEYYISARDLLQNRNLKFSDDGDPYVYEAGNHQPNVNIISPQDGDTLQGVVTFRWEGDDPDADQDLGYRLEYKLADEDDSEYRELTPVSGTSATYDTSQQPDGTYDVRVVANDGFAEATAVVQVTFDNAESVAQPNELSATRFRLGEPVTFTTEVNQAAQSVTLFVTRDGETVTPDGIPMRDDGQPPDAEAGDSIYSATAEFNQSGRYSWYVEVSYQHDGNVVTDQSEEGQSFEVSATAGQVFERNLGLWIAIIVLTAAALGIGAYALRNHQQGP